MLVFVTVGSTRFDALIAAMLEPPMLALLAVAGYTRLVLQIGNSTLRSRTVSSTQNGDAGSIVEGVPQGMQVDYFRFKPSLVSEVAEADLIFSHAGAGSILEALRAQKKLVVVVNEDLMDNHQLELAEGLSQGSYLFHCTPGTLLKKFPTFNFDHLRPYPNSEDTRFCRIVDAEVGFLP